MDKNWSLTFYLEHKAIWLVTYFERERDNNDNDDIFMLMGVNLAYGTNNRYEELSKNKKKMLEHKENVKT